MFEEIRDIIAEQLSIDDLDELTLDTSLKDDLNADSLDAVEVIMALEDKYDIEISEEDAEEFIKDYKISAEDDVCIETYMVMCRLL